MIKCTASSTITSTGEGLAKNNSQKDYKIVSSSPKNKLPAPSPCNGQKD
jgi:hypothetical protein